MKRTQSQVKMPTYELSGKELTIYWDEQELNRESVEGEQETVYSYAYCVASVFDNRDALIEKIMATQYPTYGSEVAAICNGGEDAENHEAMRQTAKTLADGWKGD